MSYSIDFTSAAIVDLAKNKQRSHALIMLDSNKAIDAKIHANSE